MESPPVLLLLIIILPIIFFQVSTGTASFARTITVSQLGPADFSKVQDAINAVPPNNTLWILIKVSPGVYVEKVTIPREKPFIFLLGSGTTTTLIKWGDHDKTDQSATFTSLADNFVAKALTFENYYNINADAIVKQAVAARIYGDQSAFYDCGFLGLQDTLMDASGRHYFSNCLIEGAVDFIFGAGQSYYENSKIKVNFELLPRWVNYGFITAQKRELQNDTNGFVFNGGTVEGTGKVFLGRAWGPSSRVVFLGTTFNIDVMPAGWDAWNIKSTATLEYVEQNCGGRGSDVSQRVAWAKHNLPQSQLQAYSRANFIQDGWLATQPQA